MKVENVPGTNTGHGYVWPRPDGAKTRCGGPALCIQCHDDRKAMLAAAAEVAK